MNDCTILYFEATNIFILEIIQNSFLTQCWIKEITDQFNFS